MTDFTVVVPERAFAASVSVTLDILHAARALAPRCGAAAPRWRLCSLHGGSVRLQRGVSVETARLPRSGRDASVWIVPALGMDEPGSLRRRLDEPDAGEIAARLRRHVVRGGQAAASCSAVFLFQRAGLLAGRTATTAWWLAPLLSRLEPECRVDADRMICEDGGVVTAGAALAQTDLVLYLLRRRCGNALAESVSRMLLIDGREAQAPFIAPALLAAGNALVAQLTTRIESSLPAVPTVAALAAERCMSERTLARHVRRATGKSPLALIQSVRLQRARALLEHSRMPIERIAAEVGYQDPTALRRLMKKLTGTTPSAYR
ncbi:helix-turn-helix domain-containing protein [Fontimonas sp. SYSU GA230001]|uniref:GlxA family transcriptional regulator n=1 Tax=Fontimonas sp. SYSU GA230001 TaxID=3142450 RepID=UPI0032B577E8